MNKFTLIFLTALLTTSTSISAHEFWLEATPFYQETNKQVDISIHVGENMKGDILPNISSWYSQFDVITPNGLQEVEGELGDDPAGRFTTDVEGIYSLGYLSTSTAVNLKAKKFNTYLKTQGLEKIIEQRKNLNESNKTGHEIFYRNVKTLVKIGTNESVNFFNHDFGHPVNIEPLINPYSLSIGEQLPVKITFEGEPAANLLLQAQINDNDEFRFSTRTDAQGHASIPLKHKGVWLLHTVDMKRSNVEGIDWESYWGSLTFEIR